MEWTTVVVIGIVAVSVLSLLSLIAFSFAWRGMRKDFNDTWRKF